MDPEAEPDEEAEESIAAELMRAAEELGIDLPESRAPYADLTEFVDAGGDRRVSVSRHDDGVAFEVNLYGRGARLAGGLTTDLAVVLRVPAAWTGGAGLEETREAAPFIAFRPWALVHEREPLGRVELTWWTKLDRVHLPPYDRHPRAHALLAAAHAEPVLRRLMPVNSHFNLWFSTSVANPSEAGVGYVIDPNDEGLYAVRHNGELLARTRTPQEAVALVVARLPEGLGPAA
ncbi:DUF6193 family natural product biosynthesis protein [Kitasatospora indigofera]|uniref:DUF6193 family natural product biosynthesis protein n=1 Tax=Kitasatospora indigofera TaxID=67307 RepID=UPI003648B3CC